MNHKALCTFAAVLAANGAAMAEVAFELGAGRLVLDEAGYVSSLKLGDQVSSLAGYQPAMMLETDGQERRPTSITMKDDRLSVLFEGGGRAEWSVARHPGFVLLRLTKLACDRPSSACGVRPSGARQGHRRTHAKRRHAGGWTVAVLATSLNVQAQPEPLAARAGSRPAQGKSVLALVAQTPPASWDRAGGRGHPWPARRRNGPAHRAAGEIAAGLPSPRPGGEWSKRSPWIHRSYLFLTISRIAV